MGWRSWGKYSMSIFYYDRDRPECSDRFVLPRGFDRGGYCIQLGRLGFYAVVSFTHFWRAFAQLLSPIVVAWVSQWCKMSAVMIGMATETGISWY
jgi:hypothetical protein